MGEENTEPITYEKQELESMTVEQLKSIAKDKNIVGYSSMNKADLITAILTP
ncbi:termination factor Rho [Clostridium botulinum]|nr:termination factor Rho [Clostridium botulinum]NEZ83801.1 termination factor Rho [Clostridium botulinum]NFA06942.1 termination factor Rho [Clostridium botulinum]NFA25878.1 termination factor Rho [Clostridium botulinum]NFB80799.1 termination factor Rho [Clostridium botulinum]